MGPIAAVKSVIKNYASMTGRASRSEFWWWSLIQFAFIAALYSAMAGMIFTTDPTVGITTTFMILNVVAMLFTLATIVPNITVAVRRLHDTDRSGAWYLIAFVPFIGALWLLVLFILPSNQTTNRFGTPPDADGASTPVRPRKGKSAATGIYDREDVSNAYVAAFTTDPRQDMMRKAGLSDDALQDSAQGFREHRKAEISDYYKNVVMKGANPA